MITSAERRFPVRIKIGAPPEGLGPRYTQITAWQDGNCGADEWPMTPSGTRGVLNEALSIYFGDATLATAFVARWCVGAKAETTARGWSRAFTSGTLRRLSGDGRGVEPIRP